MLADTPPEASIILSDVGSWKLVECLIPIVLNGKDDLMYLPAYAKIEDGKLVAWTTERPKELCHG